MHDLVINGGLIIDGTGAPAQAGDIAIDQGVISQVGGKAGPARRTLDAQGAMVTPGWMSGLPALPIAAIMPSLMATSALTMPQWSTISALVITKSAASCTPGPLGTWLWPMPSRF